MNRLEQRTIGGLNVQLWGQGDIPVVVFHGGPGSGLNPKHTAYFDYHRHRVVLFDQRGAGRSGVLGSIAANTTQHTLQDAEAIRVALGFNDWVILGGSWGGALGLAYAEANPDRVRSLIVRSSLICCNGLEQWMLHDRAKRFEAGKIARDLFLEPLDSQERQRPVAAWFARMSENDIQARDAARRVIALESAFHGPKAGSVKLVSAVSSNDVARSRLYLWYWLNAFFLPDNEPANPKSISRLPHRLIHGKDDLICPIEHTLAFAKRGNLEFESLSDAGHNGLAAPMIASIRRALKDLNC